MLIFDVRISEKYEKFQDQRGFKGIKWSRLQVFIFTPPTVGVEIAMFLMKREFMILWHILDKKSHIYFTVFLTRFHPHSKQGTYK